MKNGGGMTRFTYYVLFDEEKNGMRFGNNNWSQLHENECRTLMNDYDGEHSYMFPIDIKEAENAFTALIRHEIIDFEHPKLCYVLCNYGTPIIKATAKAIKTKGKREAHIEEEYLNGFNNPALVGMGELGKIWDAKQGMTDTQYLDVALDFIVEREGGDDYICERMYDIPEEYEICARDCQNLDRICVLRFLKELWQRKNDKNTSTT